VCASLKPLYDLDGPFLVLSDYYVWSFEGRIAGTSLQIETQTMAEWRRVLQSRNMFPYPVLEELLRNTKYTEKNYFHSNVVAIYLVISLCML
jgi:hypothetical protein